MFSIRKLILSCAVVVAVCAGAYLSAANAAPAVAPAPAEPSAAPILSQGLFAPDVAMMIFVGCGGLVLLLRPKRRSM